MIFVLLIKSYNLFVNLLALIKLYNWLSDIDKKTEEMPDRAIQNRRGAIKKAKVHHIKGHQLVAR